MKKVIFSTVAFMFVMSLHFVGTADTVIWGSDERGEAVHFTTSPAATGVAAKSRLDKSNDLDTTRSVVWGSDERGEAQHFASSPAFSGSQQPEGEPSLLTVSGTIGIENEVVWYSEERSARESLTLRKADGEIFELANNSSSQDQDLKNLSGQSVEIKGTVLEDAGRKTIEVSDYNVVK